MLEQQARHATAIPSRKYPFSSDPGSQTGLGSTSTRLSDRPGTLGTVVFMNRPHNGARQPVLLPILFLPSYLLPFHLQLAWPSMQTQSVWLHSAWHATGHAVWRDLDESLLPSYQFPHFVSHADKHTLVKLLLRASCKCATLVHARCPGAATGLYKVLA